MAEKLDEKALCRPIIGIENRTAQEAFDIMCDRFRAFLAALPSPSGAKAVAWQWRLDHTCEWQQIGNPEYYLERGGEIRPLYTHPLPAEVGRVLASIPAALNDAFTAGMEEREGGSAKRQERCMKSGEELRRAARDLLSKTGRAG